MGFWSTNKQGVSFAVEEGEPELVWSDGPADAMDDAMQRITEIFSDEFGRLPSVDELVAGVRFSANVMFPPTVSDAKAFGHRSAEEWYESNR